MLSALRSTALRRVLTSYLLFTICEYALWIAMLVFAYERGGATTAGLVAFAQLLPSAGVALAADPLARRFSAGAVLVGGYLVQAAGAAATAVAVYTGAPALAAYAGAVVVSTALTLVRPIQTSVLPALATEASQLTSANVLVGLLESVSVLLAGVGTGLALTYAGVADVFAVATVLLLACAALSLPLRAVRTRPQERLPLTAVRSRPRTTEGSVRSLIRLIGTQKVVAGALDILFVVLAVEVLRSGPEWTGYLNTAYGAGALAFGVAAAWVVGRRLGPVVVVTALGAGAALGATVSGQLGVVVVLLVVAGGMRAVLDLALRLLLQRCLPPDQLVRTFGAAEGLSMLGLCVGSLLVPALVTLGGTTTALIGVAVLLPLHVALEARNLWVIDATARVPVVEIALLRQLSLFHLLPGPTTEALAGAMARVQLAPGEVLVREGEPGDRYFAVADGELVVEQDGREINRARRGDGVGEIALLQEGPRTATVRAVTSAAVYAIERDDFLNAVTGHASTFGNARSLVTTVMERDETRRRSTAPEA